MNCSYCIITPAFNEADYIGKAIESVLSQTILPHRWVIIDDGSTDNTSEIIKSYSDKYKWVKYIYREKIKGQAYYASNVHAIMAGWRSLQAESFDYLAILDADITLPDTYYEQVFGHFLADSRLGVASGIYENLIDGKLHKVLNDRRSTPKAIQVFRREVFEQIGGFLPLKYGGEDTIACVMARMTGWKAWSFPDIKVVHHRPTGMGNKRNIFRIRFNQGVCEYSLGSHPVFFIIKSSRRALLEKPFILGGILRLCGYFWAFFSRKEMSVPPHVVRYIKEEHKGRLLKFNKI